jgi:hypothetical protein
MAHVSRLLYHYEGFVSNGTKFEPERSILSGNSVYYEGLSGVSPGRSQQDLRLCVQIIGAGETRVRLLEMSCSNHRVRR